VKSNPESRPGVLTSDEDMRERARQWVERTTEAQGLPVKISDPATIQYIASLLRQGRMRRLGLDQA
jgi:hypothetical protein